MASLDMILSKTAYNKGADQTARIFEYFIYFFHNEFNNFNNTRARMLHTIKVTYIFARNGPDFAVTKPANHYSGLSLLMHAVISLQNAMSSDTVGHMYTTSLTPSPHPRA